MLLHLKFIRDIWKVNVRPVQVLFYRCLSCLDVKMLLVFHPICNSADISLWFIVSQFVFVKVYISVKVQLKFITVNTAHLSFPISFIGKIYTLHLHSGETELLFNDKVE